MGSFPFSTAHVWHSLQQLPAEGMILCVLLGCLGADLFVPAAHKALIMRLLGVVGAVLALVALFLMPVAGQSLLFFGHFVINTGLQYTKVLLIVGYLLSLLLFDWDGRETCASSYPSLLAALVLGTLLTCAAHSFLALYLSITLSAVSGYLLCGAGEMQTSRSVALRYALFGMLGMGSLLYGFSLFYGLSGGTTLLFGQAFGKSLQIATSYQLPILLLILMGFLFKLGAFPLHFWVPSVYSHMPLPALAYLSTAAKIAMLVLLYRLSGHFDTHPQYGLLLAILGVGTVLWGDLSALTQHTPRKLLAYSSVAYSGLFMLFIATGKAHVLPILFGSTFYLLAQYVAFASVATMEKRGVYTLHMPVHFSRAERYRLGIPLALAFVVLSGLPPFAGFTTKFLIFSTLLGTSSAFFLVACLLVLLSSIWALVYYIRPIYSFFIQPGAQSNKVDTPLPIALVPALRRTLLYALLLLLLGLFVHPMPIFGFLSTCIL